jgi:hypothetical protein
VADTPSIVISAGALGVAATALVRTEVVRRTEARDRTAELRRRATPLLTVEIAAYRRLSEGGLEVEVDVVNNGSGMATNVRVSVSWMGIVPGGAEANRTGSRCGNFYQNHSAIRSRRGKRAWCFSTRALGGS